MKRVIREIIYEFKKYERDLSIEEIEKLIYNATKIQCPGVKLSIVKREVNKHF